MSTPRGVTKSGPLPIPIPETMLRSPLVMSTASNASRVRQQHPPVRNVERYAVWRGQDRPAAVAGIREYVTLAGHRIDGEQRSRPGVGQECEAGFSVELHIAW